MFLIGLLSCTLNVLLIIFVISNEYYSRKLGVPAAPTLPWVRKELITLLKKHKKEGEHIHLAELGCGWGGLMLKINQNIPNIQITGFEKAPMPYIFSWIRCLFYKNIECLYADFFKEDLTKYDILVCYLTSQLMKDLYDKHLKDSSSDFLIFSLSFQIEGLIPAEAIKVSGPVPIFIYVYKIGAIQESSNLPQDTSLSH